MGITKVELFDRDIQEQAVLFKAMGHPARLAILRFLASSKTCITTDIAEELPLSRTTVAQHLKELKDAGLIQGTTEGVKTNYCLNPLRIHEIRAKFNALFDDLDQTDNICCV